jgi:chromosome segregation ATPase
VSFDYEAVDELLQKECKHKFITITNLTHAYFGKTVCVNCEIEYKKYLEQENADLRAKLAEKDDFIMEQNKVIKHFNEEYAPATEYIKIAESFIDSHKKLEELYPKLLNKNDELQAKLKAAEIKIDDYDKLTQLQHQAGIRATKLYNDKHGTHIGLMDFAKGEVFLMEEIDGLKVKLKMTADKLRVTEKARNGLNLYSHKLERQCDELKFKLEAAEIKIDELQTRNTVLFNTRQNIQAVLDMVRHELDETYIDENGTTWTRPTAWAYYAVCKARDMWHKQAIENQEEAIELQSQVAL